AARLRVEYAAKIKDADVAVFGPPPVRGVGRAGGFRIMVEDRGEYGPRELQRQTDALALKGNRVKQLDGKPALAGLVNVFRADVPQLYVDAGREQLLEPDVDLKDVINTLQVYPAAVHVTVV